MRVAIWGANRMLTNGDDKMRISVVILNFGHASQRSDGFEVFDVLPRGPWIQNLDVLPRGLMDLNLDMLPRGPTELDLDMLPRGPLIFNLDVLPRGLMV